MLTLRSDPALYINKDKGKLIGLSGTYVDDIMRVGNDQFRKLSKKTNDMFEMAEDEEIPCRFTGFKLERDNGIINLQQSEYLSKLNLMPEDATFADFASMRMRLAWLSHNRPECLFGISQLTQVTRGHFEENCRTIIRDTNKLIEFARENDISISFPQLDLKSLRVIGFYDASFAGNKDFTSQLGYVVFISDKNNRAIPIFFKSYKARRVTRSVMGAELIAFSDMFDGAFTLAAELRDILGKPDIPVNLFTDSKTLFDVISKGTRTSEKRLMLDIACAREGFKNHEISNIGFIGSSNNLADGLTKKMSQEGILQAVQTGILNVHVEQWIIRKI